ncbi:MAG: S41 family peptidase [Dehalobacterium sp.]
MKKLLISLLSGMILLFLFTNTGNAAEKVFENPDVMIVINAEQKMYQNVPIMVNGSILLPLREILIDLGVQDDDEHIIWNSSDRSITVIKDSIELNLWIDHNKARVNGEDVELAAAPAIYQNKTYIPAAFVARSFGKKVTWDSNTNKVIIADETNYQKIEEILNNSSEKMSLINKYKLSQTLEVNDLDDALMSTASISSTYQIDQKKRIYSGSFEMIYSLDTTENKINMDIWGDDSGIYNKQNHTSIWEKTDLAEDELAFEMMSVFDAYYFLKPDSVICSGLKEETNTDESELLLKGDIFPQVLAKLLVENGEINKTFFKESSTEIYIDKETGVFKRVLVKCSNGREDDLKEDASFSWINSDFNGNFAVIAPADFKAMSGAYDANKKGYEELDAENYEEAIKEFERAIKLNSKLSDAYFGKGIAQYYLDDPECLDSFDQAFKLNPKYEDPLVWKAKTYLELGDNDQALELCDQALSINPNSYFALNIKGQVYDQLGRYHDALNALNRSIEINREYEDSYITKIAVLYWAKNYHECIDFANIAQVLFPENEYIPWYKAECYSTMMKYENAVKEYQKVLKINPENDTVIAYIAWEYYYLQDYKKSEEYMNKALKINSQNSDAIILQEALAEAKLPANQRIVNFVNDYYLYADKINDFDEKSKDFLAKKHVAIQDIENYINQIKLPDDNFSFVISCDDYDQFINLDNNSNILTKKIDDNTYYIRIISFTASVALDFKGFIDSIDNPETKDLIIDLRDNGGGLAQSANDILDFLLPECVTSFTIDRDGYISTYYSDENQVKFKKIVVLVNEYSASSSELLALGLKKYLNNVTIIGQPTLGKGVGQYTYEDKAQKYIIFLVSYYWNVKEQNITGTKITPDIIVKSSNEEDYFNEIKRIK